MLIKYRYQILHFLVFYHLQSPICSEDICNYSNYMQNNYIKFCTSAAASSAVVVPWPFGSASLCPCFCSYCSSFRGAAGIRCWSCFSIPSHDCWKCSTYPFRCAWSDRTHRLAIHSLSFFIRWILTEGLLVKVLALFLCGNNIDSCFLRVVLVYLTLRLRCVRNPVLTLWSWMNQRRHLHVYISVPF